MFLIYLSIFGISMVPIMELRGAIPFGMANGVDMWVRYLLAVVGSSVVIPIFIRFTQKILNFFRRFKTFKRFVEWVENKTVRKIDQVGKHKYLLAGLYAFAAIPLPGTGAWTGSMIAAFMNLRVRDAMPAIVLGNITAGLIMVLLSYVGIMLF